MAGVMERFGRGEAEARATEHGPSELRSMCSRFNEMAAAIAAQRRAQIAFLGGVAHDLRNPLATLQLSVALLGPERSLPPEPRVRQMVARITRQLARKRGGAMPDAEMLEQRSRARLGLRACCALDVNGRESDVVER